MNEKSSSDLFDELLRSWSATTDQEPVTGEPAEDPVPTANGTECQGQVNGSGDAVDNGDCTSDDGLAEDELGCDGSGQSTDVDEPGDQDASETGSDDDDDDDQDEDDRDDEDDQDDQDDLRDQDQSPNNTNNGQSNEAEAPDDSGKDAGIDDHDGAPIDLLKSGQDKPDDQQTDEDGEEEGHPWPEAHIKKPKARQHKHFKLLLKLSQLIMPNKCHGNVWLAGPAGSGKTHASMQVAKQLGMNFYFNGAVTNEFALLGFVTASGSLVRTPFREAWENGGVFLFDEVDASSANAIVAFNAALAQGACPFPDGMVARHKDCIIHAGSNTTGSGSGAGYFGRNRMDESFISRFIMIDWPIDEALEASFSGRQEWVKLVQALRSVIAAKGVKGVSFSPRDVIHGLSLIHI